MPIVLVGLPGSGKSSVARALSERLGLAFVDSDEEIKRETGTTIAQFFEAHGESSFRVFERQTVAQLIQRRIPIIALGGGAFCDVSTRALVKAKCVSIWLDAPLEILVSRLATSDQRPLLNGTDLFKTLHVIADARQPSYAEADHIVENIDFGQTLLNIEEKLRPLTL